MKYSVVIVTFNRMELLKECIDCVLNQTVRFSEVIIVNNCSTDGTDEYLTEIKENDLQGIFKCYSLDKNIGGAGGFKYGLSKVGIDIDWVLIIDDDAMLDTAYIENIQEHIMKNDYLAYSGSVVSNGIIDTTHRRKLINRILVKAKDISIDMYNKEAFEYNLSTFCGLLINRGLMDKIGLPNEEYFIWYDDTEYSMRIGNYSKILNVNSAVLNHKIGKDNQIISWKSYYGCRNSIHMGKKHSTNKMIFIIYTYFNYTGRILLGLFRMLFSKEKKEYGRICTKLYSNVLKDSFRGKLGISDNYRPGQKI